MEGVEKVLEVVQLLELREKDFGSEEGKRFGTRGKPEALDASRADWVDPESQDSMKNRIERFVDAHFVPNVLQAASDASAGSVVIVAHGIILNVLLRSLLLRFGPEEIAKLAKPGDASWRSEWLASWSNTGYLEADLQVATPMAMTTSDIPVPEQKLADGPGTIGPGIAQEVNSTAAPSEDVVAAGQPGAVLVTTTNVPVPTLVSVSPGIQLVVRTVNCVEHLQGLKKTRGGIGSAGHDEKQKTVDSFFTRPAKKLKRDESGV